MSCECKSGCGCSKCTAPAVETNLIDESWDQAFLFWTDWALSQSGFSGDNFHFIFYVGPATIIPSITIDGPGTGRVGDDLTFVATMKDCVADPDGWVWSVDNATVIGSSTGATIVLEFATVGIKNIRVTNTACPTAKNGFIQTTIAAASANPQITVSGPGTGDTGEILTFSAVSISCTPDPVWVWDTADGTVIGNASDSVIEITFPTPGPRSISVTNVGCPGAVGEASVTIDASQVVTGACCLPGGSCAQLSVDACTAAGGTYYGGECFTGICSTTPPTEPPDPPDPPDPDDIDDEGDSTPDDQRVTLCVFGPSPKPIVRDSLGRAVTCTQPCAPGAYSFDAFVPIAGPWDGELRICKYTNPTSCRIIPLHYDAEAAPAGSLRIGWYTPATALLTGDVGSVPLNVSLQFSKVQGTADLYWTMSFASTGWPGASTAVLKQKGITTLVPGVHVGPILTGEWVSLTVTPTGMVADTDYLGTLTLTGYTAAGVVTNVETKQVSVRVGSSNANHTFRVEPPAQVARSVGFNTKVTALDSNGNVDPSYSGGMLLLSIINQAAPPDSILAVGGYAHAEIDSSGQWVNGVFTIPGVVFGGGTGLSQPTLEVFDWDTLTSGTAVLNTSRFRLTINAGHKVTRNKPFDLIIQALGLNGNVDTTYTPTGNVDITMTPSSGVDTMTPLLTNNQNWLHGAKTVACTITGENGDVSFDIEATDGTQNAIASGTCGDGSFAVTANGGANILRDVPFSIAIQAKDTLGANWTTYQPTADVNIGIQPGDVADGITPTTTDNTGWSGGAKTVPNCVITGGAGIDDADIGIEDDTWDSVLGFVTVSISDMSFTLTVNDGDSVTRGVPFDLIIQARDGLGNPVMGYVPATDVDIAFDGSDANDAILPISTDDSGWSANGSKVVSCTIDGGAGQQDGHIDAADATTAAWVGASATFDVELILFTLVANGGSNVVRAQAFDLEIQAIDFLGNPVLGFTPAGNVDIVLTSALGDSILPIVTSNTGWTDGAKTQSCTIDGGSGTGDYGIDVTDSDSEATGSIDGTITFLGAVAFEVTAPADSDRYADISVVIQAIDMNGDPVTTYSPTTSVTLGFSSSDASDTMTPLTTDNQNWVNGAKTVTCNFGGGDGADTASISATDDTTSITGNDAITITDSIPANCAAIPNNVTISWSGKVQGQTYTSFDEHSGVTTLNSSCVWIIYFTAHVYGYHIHIYKRTGYWEVVFSTNFASSDWDMWIVGRKGGNSPIGTYTEFSRVSGDGHWNDGATTNTLSGISVS